MKAKYVGAASGAVSAFGAVFNPEAEVDDRYAGKIEGNPFFEVVGSSAKSTEKATSSSSVSGSRLEAREVGHGWYAIFDGDERMDEKSLRKDDAEAFNAMSAADKAEYVANN